MLKHIDRFAEIKGEKGFAMVWLVIAMVLIASLAAAVLSFTSSSSIHKVMDNLQVKAYYLAESGYRYASSQFVHAATPAMSEKAQETARDDMLETMHDKKYTLQGSLGSFRLKIYPYFYKTIGNSSGTSLATEIKGGFLNTRTIPASGFVYIDGKAAPTQYTSFTRSGSNVTFTLVQSETWTVDTTVLPVAEASGVQTMTRNVSGNVVASLSLTSASAEAFPQYNGTFHLASDPTIVYAYQKRNVNVLEKIVKLSDPSADFSVSVANLEKVTNRKYMMLYSTGTIGSGDFIANETIKYPQPVDATGANQGGGSGAPYVPDSDTVMQGMETTGPTSTGAFDYKTNVDGGAALAVTSTTSGSGGGNQKSTEAYVMLPAGLSNPLYQRWDGAGSYLSYDVQAKFATAVDTNTGDGVNIVTFGAKPATYAAGISFRATPTSTQSTYYGISYMRSNTGAQGEEEDGIADSLIPPYPVPSGTPAWQKDTNYTVGTVVLYDSSYYQCTVAHTSGKKFDDTKWSLLTNDNQAMIVLWTRNGNKGNGDDNWLAYKRVYDTDYVVDGSGLLNHWSTLLVRVLEAASVKLTDNNTTDPVVMNQIITGGDGSSTAKVVRVINDNDGNAVLLLNKVQAGFTRPGTIGSHTTNSTWGYRARDNYIWVFYGQNVTDYGSDNTPIDNTRLHYPRQTITGTPLDWPVTNLSDWSATGDKFTLVQWQSGASDLNTSEDSALRIMGYGPNESGGIIRTSKWTTDSYTLAEFPPEMGLVALGKYATQTYFDDFTFALPSSGASGGIIGFYPPVQFQ